jgi:hypothetical protein
MLGYRLDETRTARIVNQALAKEPDALGQRLVGDRHVLPDFT